MFLVPIVLGDEALFVVQINTPLRLDRGLRRLIANAIYQFAGSIEWIVDLYVAHQDAIRQRDQAAQLSFIILRQSMHDLTRHLPAQVIVRLETVADDLVAYPELDQVREVVVSAHQAAQHALGEARSFIHQADNRHSSLRQTTSVAILVAEALRRAQSRLLEKTLTISRDGDAWHTVMSYEGLFIEVLREIIHNAFDATEDSAAPLLRIVAEVDSSRKSGVPFLRLIFEDNGKGIPHKVDPESLFEANVTTKPLGTGTGLFVARTFLRAHRGEIRFDTECHAGARLIVEHPIHLDRETP